MCQCVTMSHILMLYFRLSESIHTGSTLANNNGPHPVTISITNDDITVDAMFQNPFFCNFCVCLGYNYFAN